MVKLLAEHVFKPGSFPEYTYVSRKSSDLDIDYELRLSQALRIPGFLISIIGPSKMGKTVLCEKVIASENLIEVSGVDFKSADDFWKVLGAKVGLSLSGEYGEVTSAGNDSSQRQINKTEIYHLNKDKVINYFKENGLILVLDDFHYASEEIQLYIAQQLKDAIRKEFKVIIVSLPHRVDDAIRKNSDLSGRLSLINIEPWKIEELKEIAKRGFKKLGIEIENEIAQKIAVESLTSPQLMQYICLSICTLLKTDSAKINNIPEDILNRAYKFTTVNLEYKDVISVLSQGPNPRGNKRKIFKTKSGKSLDIYGLVMEAIADNPPLMGITLDELKNRIDKIIIDNEKKPDKQAVRESVKKLQGIINEKENIYRVIEWKDNTIYILDPLFLFYLRWGIY